MTDLITRLLSEWEHAAKQSQHAIAQEQAVLEQLFRALLGDDAPYTLGKVQVSPDGGWTLHLLPRLSADVPHRSVEPTASPLLETGRTEASSLPAPNEPPVEPVLPPSPLAAEGARTEKPTPEETAPEDSPSPLPPTSAEPELGSLPAAPDPQPEVPVQQPVLPSMALPPLSLDDDEDEESEFTLPLPQVSARPESVPSPVVRPTAPVPVQLPPEEEEEAFVLPTLPSVPAPDPAAALAPVNPPTPPPSEPVAPSGAESTRWTRPPSLPDSINIKWIMAQADSGFRVPDAATKGENPFLKNSRDPQARAQRLAETLITEITLYHQQAFEEARPQGPEAVRKVFQDEIDRARVEYDRQIKGEPLENADAIFRGVLNQILADGASVY